MGNLGGFSVSKKKNKFDLTHLVHDGQLKDGEMLVFVSDPNKKCIIAKQPNGEYKVTVGAETMTVHAFAQKCLGEDPPRPCQQMAENRRWYHPLRYLAERRNARSRIIDQLLQAQGPGAPSTSGLDKNFIRNSLKTFPPLPKG
jgi:hypothetical protein